MKHPINTSKYIEIPYENKGRSFEGADCWGLVRLVYLHEYQIQLSSFTNEYTDASESENVKEVIRYGKSLVKYKEKSSPEYGDIIIFKFKGNPCHVGIFIGDNKVLHIMKGTNSVCERLNSIRLKGRIEGYYEITEKSRGASLQTPSEK